MFINLSNHPSALWSEEQTATARQQYGDVIDLSFPTVDPEGDEAYIDALADEYCTKVMMTANGQPVTVHAMGEMNFTFALVTRLLALGATCVASTTDRSASETADGHKTSCFKFIRFRKYQKSHESPNQNRPD